MRSLAETKAHRAAIHDIVERWFNHEITTRQKQEMILAENEFFSGHAPRRQLELVLTASHAEDDEDRFWWQK